MESANREKYFMKQEIENTDESDNKPKSIVKNVKEVLQIQTPTVMESALGNKELEVQNRRLNAVQETLSSSNSKRKAVDQSDLVGANEHHELKFKSIIGMPKSEFKEHFDIKLECTAMELEDENNVGNEYLINNEEERGYLKFQSASLQDIDDFRAFKREGKIYLIRACSFVYISQIDVSYI